MSANCRQQSIPALYNNIGYRGIWLLRFMYKILSYILRTHLNHTRKQTREISSLNLPGFEDLIFAVRHIGWYFSPYSMGTYHLFKRRKLPSFYIFKLYPWGNRTNLMASLPKHSFWKKIIAVWKNRPAKIATRKIYSCIN